MTGYSEVAAWISYALVRGLVPPNGAIVYQEFSIVGEQEGIPPIRSRRILRLQLPTLKIRAFAAGKNFSPIARISVQAQSKTDHFSGWILVG